jgi:hypothetical protein
MCVWMMSHIGFFTIGNCDLLSFFLLIESLPAACKFHPLFFFCTWSSSYVVSSLFLFNPCTLLFFYDPFFWWEDIPVIGGLLPPLSHAVRIQNSTTLAAAMSLAHQVELMELDRQVQPPSRVPPRGLLPAPAPRPALPAPLQPLVLPTPPVATQ